MKVVAVSASPPVGPSFDPTGSTSSQGIAPGATKLASADIVVALPRTTLLSRECCQVGRIGLPGQPGSPSGDGRTPARPSSAATASRYGNGLKRTAQATPSTSGASAPPPAARRSTAC